MRSSTVIFTILSLCSTMAYVALAQNSPEDFLGVHNEARAKVGVRPLVWNKTLEAYAKNYAKKKQGDCEMEHSMGPYGENLAENFGTINARDAVKFWLTEEADYDHRAKKCKKAEEECMHYTQVIWRDTTSVGCAVQKCKNNWMFLICNYWPVGNIDGQKAY